MFLTFSNHSIYFGISIPQILSLGYLTSCLSCTGFLGWVLKPNKCRHCYFTWKMFQTEVVIFTLESVISISTNASGFLQSYRVLLIVQQSPHCEIIISLAFYALLYHSCKHKSVTSQTMDSFHIKQFKFLKINSDLEGFFFDWVGFRV